MQLKSRNKVNASFSMSSMTDIVFLLLIFFIVLSTFVSIHGLDIDLPQTKENQKPIQSQMVVEVTKDLAYAVNGESTNFEGVIQQLKTKLNEIDAPSLILMADAKVDWETGMQIIAEAKSLGYTKIVVRTKPVK